MKKKKLLIRLGAVLAALALLCAAGYLILFYHADVLKIEDGKISGLKSTWLTAQGQRFLLITYLVPNYT